MKRTYTMFFTHLLTITFLSIVVFPEISFSASKGLNAQKIPYSLTISGGISLGGYEAGLNWVIMKQ